MVTVNETSRVGLGTQRRRAGTSSATRSVSDRSLAGQCLEPFRRACAALVAGLALCCAGLVGMVDAATMAEFALPAMNSNPYGVTTGPDGALWFTEFSANKIGRITTAGVVTEFALPVANRGPLGITAGPDGALWFTEWNGDKIGRITTAGVVTEFALPTAGSSPGITAGPDGALWFTEFSAKKIGRITTAGVVTEFALSTSSHSPHGITAGPDGALWFTEWNGDKIGRITTAGVVTEFALPTADSSPGITAGPDGALWFTEFSANKIGRITTAGVVTEFALPTAGRRPWGITAGPDGALWFAEHDSNKIGRIVPDPVWSATVSLNGSALRTGQTLTYQATLFPGTTPTSVDIYLGVLLPDGLTFLSFILDPGGTVAFTVGPVPVPYSTGVTLTPLTVPFVYTFSGSEPAGTYFAYATLVAAGTDPLQDANRLALGIQTFEFSP